MHTFEPDPARPDVHVWKQSNARATGAGITAVLLALLATGGLVAMTGALFAASGPLQKSVMFLILCLLTVSLASLARLCWRQARGQFGLRIELHPHAIVLALPADRSLVHHPDAEQRRLDSVEITRVLTREEAFAAQWMAMLQRTYWLELAQGGWILLFEDRALQTDHPTRSLMPVAEAIAGHLVVPLEALPAVEGRGGVLGAWWTAAPAVDAPAIAPDRRAALIRRIALTGFASVIALAVVVLSMLTG